jgi:hypothetical protein
MLTTQSVGSLLLYELVSQLLAICQIQKPSVLQSHSKITGFDTYDHIVSRTLPSSNYFGSYCCRKTQRMIDSYPNFFCTIEHKLSTSSRESDLLSQFVHRSEGDKQN